MAEIIQLRPLVESTQVYEISNDIYLVEVESNSGTQKIQIGKPGDRTKLIPNQFYNGKKRKLSQREIDKKGFQRLSQLPSFDTNSMLCKTTPKGFYLHFIDNMRVEGKNIVGDYNSIQLNRSGIDERDECFDLILNPGLEGLLFKQEGIVTAHIGDHEIQKQLNIIGYPYLLRNKTKLVVVK